MRGTTAVLVYILHIQNGFIEETPGTDQKRRTVVTVYVRPERDKDKIQLTNSYQGIWWG
jgi:hypothetical protein